VLTLYVVPMAYFWIARNTGSPKAVENKLNEQLEQQANPKS